MHPEPLTALLLLYILPLLISAKFYAISTERALQMRLKKIVISLYSNKWLAFITETEGLMRGTNWIFKYTSD